MGCRRSNYMQLSGPLSTGTHPLPFCKHYPLSFELVRSLTLILYRVSVEGFLRGYNLNRYAADDGASARFVKQFAEMMVPLAKVVLLALKLCCLA